MADPTPSATEPAATDPKQDPAPAGDATAPKTDPPKPEPKQDPPNDEPLGDAGKAALDAERAARKAAEKLAREAQAALRKREEADMSEHERAVAEARKEGATEVTKAFQTRLLNAEIRARAAGKLANPELAVKLVDLGDGAFDDDGEINAKAIDAEIERLLKDEPYLAAAPPEATRPHVDLDGGKGSAGGSSRTVDMNELIRGGSRGG